MVPSLTFPELTKDKKNNGAGHHLHIYIHARAFVQIVTEVYCRVRHNEVNLIEIHFRIDPNKQDLHSEPI